MKKTLVLGASPNPDRYSYKAIKLLTDFKHEVVAIGVKEGEVFGTPILKEWYKGNDIDTVTLYIGPKRQLQYYDQIINLKPKRIIFNPGTENDELIGLAQKAGIKTIEDCTLVMLRNNQF